MSLSFVSCGYLSFIKVLFVSLIVSVPSSSFISILIFLFAIFSFVGQENPISLRLVPPHPDNDRPHFSIIVADSTRTKSGQMTLLDAVESHRGDFDGTKLIIYTGYKS